MAQENSLDAPDALSSCVACREVQEAEKGRRTEEKQKPLLKRRSTPTLVTIEPPQADQEEAAKKASKRKSRKGQREGWRCTQCDIPVCSACSLPVTAKTGEKRMPVCYTCLPAVLLTRSRAPAHQTATEAAGASVGSEAEAEEALDEFENQVRTCAMANMLNHIQTAGTEDSVRESLMRLRRSTVSDGIDVSTEAFAPRKQLSKEEEEENEKEKEEKKESELHVKEEKREVRVGGGMELPEMTIAEVLSTISAELNSQSEYETKRRAEEAASDEADCAFETTGSGKVNLKLKVVGKMVEGLLWYCGMKDGTQRKLNRRPIEKVSMRKVEREEVASVTRVSIPTQYYYDLENLGYDLDDYLGVHKEAFAEARKKAKQQQEKEAPDNVWQLPAIVYRPKDAPKGLLPALLWIHGGGFVMGSPEDSVVDRLCRQLSNAVGCVVVSLDYRLAPEFRWPTPVEDSYAALRWLFANGKSKFQVDVSRIAVGGDSAGGNLAAVVAHLTRDRRGPSICHSLLVYPGVHGASVESESHRRYAKGPVITRSLLLWFKAQYFDCPDSNCCGHPSSSPLLAPSVAHLPPTTLILAGMDPLASHAVQYGQRLKAAGIPTTCSVYKKSPHGFFLGALEETREAVFEAIVNLKFHFQTQERVVQELLDAAVADPKLAAALPKENSVEKVAEEILEDKRPTKAREDKRPTKAREASSDSEKDHRKRDRESEKGEKARKRKEKEKKESEKESKKAESKKAEVEVGREKKEKKEKKENKEKKDKKEKRDVAKVKE